jgi:hypothetical protein
MILPIFISFLVGVVLAQRFKVLVLIPTILLSALFTVGVGFERSEPPWTVAAMAVLVIVAEQVGYLLGVAARHVMLLGRANRMNPGSAPDVPWRRAAN